MAVGISRPLVAQIIAPSAERNVVYAEIGGAGGLFSLNYERLTEQRIYVRGGIGRWSVTDLIGVHEDVRNIVAGATRRFDVSDLLGKGDDRVLEAGFAVVAGTYNRTRYDATEVDGSYASLAPTIGVRKEPPAGGFTYRVTLSRLIPFVNRASAFPRPSSTVWGGLSVGYIFR